MKIGAVHFLSLGRLVSHNLFACGGRSGEVWESASRKNRVARRVPVGVSGPLGLHLIVEEGRWVSTLSLSRAFLQLVPVRLFGTGQAAHIHEERGGFFDIKVVRRSKKATNGSNRCFGHSVTSVAASPCLLSCWQKQGFRPVLPTIGFEPMTLAVWKRYSNRWVK